MKKFNWKLAHLTLIKTFGTSFLTPLAGVQIVFNQDFLLSIYVGLITSGVMTGIVLMQVIDRYIQFVRENER